MQQFYKKKVQPDLPKSPLSFIGAIKSVLAHKPALKKSTSFKIKRAASRKISQKAGTTVPSKKKWTACVNKVKSSQQSAELSFSKMVTAIRTAIGHSKSHNQATTHIKKSIPAVEIPVKQPETVKCRAKVSTRRKRTSKVAVRAKSKYMKSSAAGVASQMHKTRLALKQRGDKLNDVENRTERMMENANNFAALSHQLMLKYRNRKWYQI